MCRNILLILKSVIYNTGCLKCIILRQKMLCLCVCFLLSCFNVFLLRILFSKPKLWVCRIFPMWLMKKSSPLKLLSGLGQSQFLLFREGFIKPNIAKGGVCECVFVYLCLCVLVYACSCVCVFLCMHVHVYVSTYMCAQNSLLIKYFLIKEPPVY